MIEKIIGSICKIFKATFTNFFFTFILVPVTDFSWNVECVVQFVEAPIQDCIRFDDFWEKEWMNSKSNVKFFGNR